MLNTMKVLYNLARLVRDPRRLDDVFEMASALSVPETVRPIVERLKQDPVLARAFADKHRLRPDLAALAALPPGTLGRVFADHMRENGLSLEAIPTLPGGDDHEFLRAHLYETHDVWHVVTGFATDFVSELGLQGFYLAQIPGPLPALLAATGFVRGALYDHSIIPTVTDDISRGYRMGKAARSLFGVRWDDLWAVPLVEVRRRFGLVVPEAPILRAA
jgi:ubiquinone biosynthesis protein COQ4